MSKTASITLGDVAYTVPALNIGQLERVADAMQGPAHRAGFAVLRIAMERATPAVDIGTVEASADEISKSAKAILEASGFTAPPEGSPPGAPGTG